MVKLILRINVVIMLLWGCVSQIFASVKPQGDGSKDCPFRITKPAELQYFAAVVNGSDDNIPQNRDACAVLMNDIDLSAVCGKTLGSWIPIGYTEETSFHGVFDGRNHRIDNIYINKASQMGQGLFGIVRKGEIKNLIMGCGLVHNIGDCAGSIVGIGSAIITDCSSYTTVKGNWKFYGGIIGYASTGAYIKRCVFYGDVNAPNASHYGMGGIVGTTSNDAIVEDCCNYGKVVGSTRVGGIAGGLLGSTIKNCCSFGEVRSIENRLCGGIYGHIEPLGGWTTRECEVNNCYYYNPEEKGDEMNVGMSCPKSDFVNGKVCKLLQKGSRNVWHQGPSFPLLNLAKIEELGKCGGKTIEKDPKVFRLYFELASTKLHQSGDEFDAILNEIKANPTKKYQIVGHADERGSNTYNYALSEGRAKVIYDLLVSNGVDKSQLNIKGVGSDNPLVKNAHNEYEHSMNRYVEIKRLGK